MKNLIKKCLFTNKWAESLLKVFATTHPFFTRFFPSNRHYARGSVRKTKIRGLSFELDISDYQEYLVYFGLESDSSKPLLDYIPETRGLVLDIGANIGQTSLWMAQKVASQQAKVLAFEPYPPTFTKLKKNVSLNNFASIELHNLALGKEDGMLKMFEECTTNSGGFRAYNSGAHGEGAVTKEVRQTSLDAFMSERSENIVFIKIDVEGFELNALVGANKTIKRDKPVLYMELSDHNLKAQNTSAKALVEFVRNELGYDQIVNIEDLKVIQESSLDNCSMDILCKSK